jgi:predicted DNA-binding protein
MAKALRTVFVDEITLARLNKLSAITRIPKAVFIREGVDLMLDKHEEKLKRKSKKKKGDNK